MFEAVIATVAKKKINSLAKKNLFVLVCLYKNNYIFICFGAFIEKAVLVMLTVSQPSGAQKMCL